MSGKAAAWVAGLGVLGALTLGFGVEARAQEADLPALRTQAKAQPADAEAALKYGRALRRAGRLAEAATELQRGTLLASAVRSDAGLTLRLELARARIGQRQVPAALAACNGFPTTAKALAAACRAEAHLAQNRAAEAEPEIDKALAVDPSLYEARLAHARALALQGKPNEAETILKGLLDETASRAEAPYHLGLLQAGDGRKEAAIASFRVAQKADPADPDVAYQLGLALGRTADGRAELEKSATIRPAFAPAQAELALAALDLGDATAAEKAATEAVKLDGTLFLGRVALGRVRVVQAKFDEALGEGEAARKLIPNAAAAELVVADAHAGKGDIDLAVEAYEKAFGLGKTDPAPLVRALRACVAAGRMTTARGFAEKLASDFPKWGPAWVEAGEMWLKAGDRPKAKTAFENALKGDGPVDKDMIRLRLATFR